MVPGIINPAHPEEAAGNVAVAARVFVQIFLMVFFSRIFNRV